MCDLPAVEIRIRDAVLGFAAKVVGATMSGPLQRAAGVNEPAGRRELRTTGILSAVGEVSNTRWYAVDANGARGFPADDALGIVCGCTPGAAKRLCHMGAKSQSYAEAAESLALLVIADGAEWIWNIVADRFKQAFAIVDFWHAADHLHELCEFIHGKGDAATESFVSLRHELKRYGVNCVIRHLKRMEPSKRSAEASASA